jgi:hypothetical protein
MSTQGWIGVDLDGTMAYYDGWKGADHIGEPIPAMVERVKRWLAEGREVRIFTARVYLAPEPQNPNGLSSESIGEAALAQMKFTYDQWNKRWKEKYFVVLPALRRWMEQHIGVQLEVTCTKDYDMIEYWDDRAVRVVINTGNPCCE